MRRAFHIFAVVFAWLSGWAEVDGLDTIDYIRPSVQDHLGGNLLTKANPGQTIVLENLSSALTYLGSTQLTLLSLTGATLDPDPNVNNYTTGGKTVHITHLPFTVVISPGCADPISLYVKVNPLNKLGFSVPVALKFHVVMNAPPDPNSFIQEVHDHGVHVNAIGTISINVTDTPELKVTASANTVHPSQLRPGGTATYLFNVDGSGSDITTMTVMAQVPSSTTIDPAAITPRGYTLSGNRVTWVVPGPVPSFAGSVGIKVKDRAGASTATASFRAAGTLNGYPRSGAANVKLAIKSLDRGRIDYATSSGNDAPVMVGGTYTYTCSGWDADGNAIIVDFNKAYLDTVPLSNPTGQFTVPPFRDVDLEQLLTATQHDGKPVYLTVPGAEDSFAEYAGGAVVIVDGTGAPQRRLLRGKKTAVGEVTFTAPTANQFGLLRFDSSTSAAVLRFGSNERFIYARNGDVNVHGVVEVGGLNLDTGAGLVRLAYQKQGSFSGYDTLSSAPPGNIYDGPSTGTITVNGPARMTNWSHAGNVVLNSAIVFIVGDAKIKGNVTGTGAIICTGSLSIAGQLQLQSGGGALDLGTQGTLTLSR